MFFLVGLYGKARSASPKWKDHAPFPQEEGRGNANHPPSPTLSPEMRERGLFTAPAMNLALCQLQPAAQILLAKARQSRRNTTPQRHAFEALTHLARHQQLLGLLHPGEVTWRTIRLLCHQ